MSATEMSLRSVEGRLLNLQNNGAMRQNQLSVTLCAEKLKSEKAIEKLIYSLTAVVLFGVVFDAVWGYICVMAVRAVAYL